ncbi:unnamed protein product [Polarella glacialis]|uniref:Uncharacterized protein n=1 Tax=Polarella glacialis TaxID=89957 RepID=A0A813D4N8_POLGL|nr:unnamed protein product [Polarella glacialis]
MTSAMLQIQTVLRYSHNVVLLAQWICSQNAVVHWIALVTCHGAQVLYDLARLISQHPRPVYKKRGLQKLAWYMRVARELPLSVVVVRLPPNLSASRAWAALRDRKELICGDVRGRWDWFVTQRFVAQPASTIRKKRFRMAQAMKAATWHFHESTPSEVMAEVNKGSELVRVKMWAKFADFDGETEARSQFLQEIHQAGGKLRLPGDRFQAFVSVLRGLVMRHGATRLPTTALQQYVASFPAHGPNFCLIQEDRDSAACWVMHVELYQLRMMDLLAQDPRWLMTSKTPEQAAADRALAINAVQLVRAKSPTASTDPVHLPNGYGAVKAKCFKGCPSSGQTHSCEKPGHSCFRKVVSWSSCETNVRQLLRSAGRAVTILVTKYCLGWETLNLKTSASDLKQRLAGLVQPTMVCGECGAQREGKYTMLVADAGQMFEQIRAPHVLRNLSLLFERARKEGFKAVLLRATRRLSGSLSRNEHVVVNNSRTWVFDDLYALVELSLHTALLNVRWGGRILQQESGSPIGGLLSRLHAMLSLGPSEGHFVDGCSYDFPRHVAAIRYVDDAAVFSSTKCGGCLRKIMAAAVPPHIVFDIEQQSTERVAWLDLTVTDVGGKLDVDVAYPEMPWLSGDSLYPERQRFPPFLDEASFSLSDFRQRIKCIVARWQQVGLHGHRLQHPVGHLILMLGRYGYPAPLCVKCLCRWGGPEVAVCAKFWDDFIKRIDNHPPRRCARVKFDV